MVIGEFIDFSEDVDHSTTFSWLDSFTLMKRKPFWMDLQIAVLPFDFKEVNRQDI